jgi:poly(3-hydroxyalkanoate) synthetase
LPRESTTNPWLDILTAQIAVGRSAINTFSSILGAGSRGEPSIPEPVEWTTPHTAFREFATLRVLDFSPDGKPAANAPVLIVAPYALHRANIADFAPGHSVVETLLRSGVTNLYLVEWRSAVPERKFDSIDTHLAELNVAVDDIGRGAPIALLGLCQGGWLATAFAARFPNKVGALALVGAPIDIAAEPSVLSSTANATPAGVIDELVKLGDGLLLGRLLLASWPLPKSPNAILDLLQGDRQLTIGDADALVHRFEKWNEDVLDLPGVFYRQAVDWIFRENRLACGRFPALGETIDLARVYCPLFLLAGREDEVVSPGQLTSIASLVGTPADSIETRIVRGNHLSLFMGRLTLADEWPELAEFLSRAPPR